MSFGDIFSKKSWQKYKKMNIIYCNLIISHEKIVIYYRKSIDRDDKQQNSIESQLSACMRIVEREWFEVLDSFIESASTKQSGKRPIFEKMLNLCKKWKIDYILIDETSRLSRNNTDSARILWLLEEQKISWIFTSSQKFFWDRQVSYSCYYLILEWQSSTMIHVLVT